MFITKKHVHRRTFLRGVGATVALPLLDAMVPAGTALARTAAAPVPRFGGIWHPHGASPGYWSPLQAGRDFVFSFITTKPLKPFRDGNHARGAVFLSGARPKRDAVTPYLAVTIDQMIADRWGRDTLLVRSGRFAVPTGRDKTLEFPFQPGHPFTQGTDRALELRETGREVAVSDSDEHREAEGRADDGDEFR